MSTLNLDSESDREEEARIYDEYVQEIIRRRNPRVFWFAKTAGLVASLLFIIGAVVSIRYFGWIFGAAPFVIFGIIISIIEKQRRSNG